MSFAIPSAWAAQPPIASGRWIRATDVSTAILNDRFTLATRRPGMASSWPDQVVSSLVTVCAVLSYRPVASRKVRLVVWGDAVHVTITDGTGSATAVIPDGSGTQSGATADLTVAASGWVTLTVTADVGGASPVLAYWQIVDATLTAGQLPA